MAKAVGVDIGYVVVAASAICRTTRGTPLRFERFGSSISTVRGGTDLGSSDHSHSAKPF